MKITSLSLFNVRSFEFAEFTFNPQFNLIAGINGAGKSTVLDAIRTCASHIVRQVTDVRINPFSFATDDIRFDAPFADATLLFTLNDHECRFTLREWRETVQRDDPKNIERLRREILDEERPSDRLRNLMRNLADTLNSPEATQFSPPAAEMKKWAAEENSAPLVIHFSTRRSWFVERDASDAKAPAYFNALRNAHLNVAETADRLRAQRALSSEHEPSRRSLELLEEAVTTFLPDFSNLRPSETGPSRVLIDQDGGTLDIRQLSDGERSVLALILDIARRLILANPNLKDPLKEGAAIILIDEIDLHLHPQWQRKIAGDLTRTFPNCQFIATTHSPQVIGETQPDQLILLKEADGRVIPQQSGQAYGLDTNYVLEQIMETPSRSPPVSAAIDAVEEALEGADLDLAREKLSELRKLQHGDDPNSVGLEAAINNLEALADEAD